MALGLDPEGGEKGGTALCLYLLPLFSETRRLLSLLPFSLAAFPFATLLLGAAAAQRLSFSPRGFIHSIWLQFFTFPFTTFQSGSPWSLCSRIGHRTRLSTPLYARSASSEICSIRKWGSSLSSLHVRAIRTNQS